MEDKKQRATIYISKAVWKQAQHKALDEEISVSQKIEDLLRTWVKS